MARKSTRSAQGSGTIRQRKDGRWEARVTIGRDPGTGKQMQRSVYGSTQQEVRKKLSQLTAAIDNGTYKEPCRMSVGEWLDIWVREYLGNIKPSTTTLYENQIRLYIKPALGSVKLEALNTHTIQSFYNGLSRGSHPLSPKSVKNVHGILHKALQKAVEIGYIRFNPSGACTLPRITKAEIHPLDEAQIGAFLKAIAGHPFEFLFKVTLFTGMREGEVIGLIWDCVDFERGTITVDKQLQKDRGAGNTYRIVPTKNSKGRIITPAHYIMDILKAQRLKQMEWRLAAGSEWEDTGLVFTNERGGHLMPHTVYHSFKRIVTQMGLPTVRFHDLRHSYAVAAIRSGDDIKTVQDNLGHATASFTLDVYGHVTNQMKQASAERMERFIQGVSSL